MIGIICAMEEEIRGIENDMHIKSESTISSVRFRYGNYQGKECVVALSGVGKVFAAICSQIMIMNYKPECIINIGTAGGIGSNINMLDLVIAKNVIQHDYDISAFSDKKRGQISGLDICEIPCSERLIKIFGQAAEKLSLNFHLGNVLTGDQFINDTAKIENLREEFDALACEMESGAIGQVCFVNKVEFAALKTISDGANKTSVNDFSNFIVRYPQIINNLIKEIIVKI